MKYIVELPQEIVDAITKMGFNSPTDFFNASLQNVYNRHREMLIQDFIVQSGVDIEGTLIAIKAQVVVTEEADTPVAVVNTPVVQSADQPTVVASSDTTTSTI